jgi:rod shape-determining protein MreC
MTAIPFRRVVTLLVVFVLVCGTFLVLDRRGGLNPVRTGLNEVISPVSSAFYRVVDAPGSDSDLEQQLAEVTADRDRLKAENSQLKADSAELAELREMQDVEDRNPNLELVPAKVLGRDPTGAQMFIIINRGSNDGIREGMAIVSPYYYVGQVVEVTETTSKVMLVIDASQSVGAMLEDSRGEGVVQGQWQHGDYLTMLYVQDDRAPKDSEWVVTSESSVTQTRQVPPNIPIGQVLGEPVVDPQTATLVIRVRPGVSNFNSLTTVYVAVEVDE